VELLFAASGGLFEATRYAASCEVSRAFRARYPAGANYVVTADTERSYVRDFPGFSVRFVSLPELIRRLAGEP